ncbi:MULTISPECIES: hypothetical protein [Paenibacillus]|uniref:hypothetical protein n=1 Tax=Paenibacillus TaxID=44249 RepID=UPI0011A63EE6|nr:hypothetical protein [Paenibacillus sp. IHBB 10380]
MKLRGVLLFVVLLIMLAGCNEKGQGTGLTKKDLSIERVGQEKSKVEYGMNRSDVEKVLGTGEKSTLNFFSYESGVRIMYREDKVAGISLEKEAADAYQSPKIKIGMLKEDIKKAYGEENVLLEADKSIDFAYDTKEGSFLTQDSKTKENIEDMEDVYLVSVVFDDNGYAERIMLLDQRMAMYMN